MKVLIVCSGNFPEPDENFQIYKAYIYDQIEILKKGFSIEFELFLIRGKKWYGYLSNRASLRGKINQGDFQIVHAHYGLAGLLAISATKLPVVITFHGSDINKFFLRVLSSVTTIFCRHSIFVAKNLKQKLWFNFSKSSVIPCGVNLDTFYPEDRQKCRKLENMDQNVKYILFASDKLNPVKNYELASESIRQLGTEVVLFELKGRTREKVRTIMNAVDGLLLTSFSEGSPQVIKEAMACNCPIVSVDVGDVREVIGSTEQCFITNYDPVMIAECLEKIINDGRRSNGRSMIFAYDNKLIAEKVHNVYKSLLKA